jgi:hypothetical protein
MNILPIAVSWRNCTLLRLTSSERASSISRPLIGISALMPFCIVAVDLTQSRADMSAAARVAARFPHANEMIIPLAKRDRMPASGCTREHWPYMADECLTPTDGATVRRPARTITIERLAENTSQLMRVEVATVASR